MNSNPLIFVVDDDKSFNLMLSSYLKSNHYTRIESYHSGEECIENLFKKPDIVVQDYDLTGMTGMDVLKKAKETVPDTEFIFLSGQSSIHVAVEIMKYGAFDYIIKDNFSKENVLNKIKRLRYIKKLELDKKSFKTAAILFFALLIVSWIVIVILRAKGIFL